MILYDAHCHLQEPPISGSWQAVVAAYRQLPVGEVVVNGTCEGDWDAVTELASRHAFVRAAYGVHPWKVSAVADGWSSRLRARLESDPSSSLGEVGLDAWVRGADPILQEQVLREQLAIAAELERPVTLHCLKAWGPLTRILGEASFRDLRILLHSYGGSKEFMRSLMDREAFFSVSAYFSVARKKRQREILKEVPLDRLLLETDAPHMAGDRAYHSHFLDTGETSNHPANIIGVYKFAAELYQMPVDRLAERVESNFRRLYGYSRSLDTDQ